MRRAVAAALLVASACSVERLPPLRVAHRGTIPAARRVIVLPPECERAGCAGAADIVRGELAFRGVEVLDLAQLPAERRNREVVELSTMRVQDGAVETEQSRTVTITGPTLSDVDAWTQRAALGDLGVDGVVRVRVARLLTHPVRAYALVRITRASDAALITASACEIEVSRLDLEANQIERALRCALEGVAP